MCCRMIKRSNITKNAVNSTPHNEELTSDVESLLGKKNTSLLLVMVSFQMRYINKHVTQSVCTSTGLSAKWGGSTEPKVWIRDQTQTSGTGESSWQQCYAPARCRRIEGSLASLQLCRKDGLCQSVESCLSSAVTLLIKAASPPPS